MFGVSEKMSHVSLLLLDDDTGKAAKILAELEVIHLVKRPAESMTEVNASVTDYQRIYHQLIQRMHKINHYLPLEKPHGEQQSNIVTLDALSKANEQSLLIWQQISTFEENIRKARENIHHAQQLTVGLKRFENLEIDLGRFSRVSEFMHIFIGTVLQNDLSQLQRALSLTNTVLEVFDKSEDYAYIAVLTEIEHKTEVKELLKTAAFHEMSIPPELNNYPENIRQELTQLLDTAHKSIELQTRDIQQVLKRHRQAITFINHLLKRAAPKVMMAEALNTQGQLVYLEGWIPAVREQQVRQSLTEHLIYPHIMETRVPRADEFASVPTLQRNQRWLGSFEKLVGQFGIPSYGEIDPTGLFAFSYILMFGMMFGDMGHGAIIIVAGILLRKKIPGLMSFAMFTGLSSILFGWLYGSVFGYETIVKPLWISPLHDPLQMLFVALVWGIAFILIVNLLSIFNLYRLGLHQQALFGGRGFAGFVLFAGGVYLVTQLFTQQAVSALALVLVVLPLTVILTFNWQKLQGSMLEKTLVTLIEALDSVINNLSNTLSFLRVAAFSLNHVALATAVFTLAAMMDGVGHWVTVVLGNLFIIVLEGAIVAIQCLRLEYYEGFSRFFQGQGKQFAPLKMET